MIAWNSDALRAEFSRRLSEMYRAEVPLYGDLVDIVEDVNRSAPSLQQKEALRSTHLHIQDSSLMDLDSDIERHGAIRLGTPSELHVIGKMFRMMGMFPVDYYNLAYAGLPIHATAFRPLTADIQELVKTALASRSLFSSRLLDLINAWEKQGSLTAVEKSDFLDEALSVFKWHGTAIVSVNQYELLRQSHPIIADIACFPSAHINHLTPRTLDIDRVQSMMVAQSMPAKNRIEGPPARQFPILLRQTSFKALEEPVTFHDGARQLVQKLHTARFGEVEQRGAALTPKGRALYDRLLAEANGSQNLSTLNSTENLSKAFKSFPDDLDALHREGLIFVRYFINSARQDLTTITIPCTLGKLIESGILAFRPLTYEDFLPISAAGIFQSNLEKASARSNSHSEDNIEEFETAMGLKITCSTDLYQKEQDESLKACIAVLAAFDVRVNLV